MNPPTLRLLSLPVLAFSLCLASGASAGSTYPTDACVADKQKATSKACKDVLGAWKTFAKGGDQAKFDATLLKVRGKLAKAWGKAESKVADEVDCAETTRTDAELAQTIEGAAAAIAAGVFDGLDLAQKDHGKCASKILGGAAKACGKLLQAESKHLKKRSKDRDQAKLESSRAKADASFGKTFGKAVSGGSCPTAATQESAKSQIDDAVAAVVLDTVVSPAVDDTQFVKIVPDRQVSYRDRDLDPQCWDGAEWSFWVRRGTVNKLLMYYQGGGACWDYLTCIAVGTHKQGTGDGDNPDNFSSGLADRGNPENPFRDWHMVMVPYCTGDVHWGDASFTYESGGESTEVHHKGFVNAQVAEKWAREHFVKPDQVFVSGSSAGAYGALANSATMMEFAYPSTEFLVLGDAGNGVVTPEFVENDLGKWGLENNLPEWIPAFNVPLGELNLSDGYVEIANTYPNSRFGTYTTAFDGSSGGQTAFYAIMLAGSPIAALEWWAASCQWNEAMTALNTSAQARAPNFRSYVGTGSRHTMWGSNKVYTDTTGGVPTIVSWVDAMIDDSPDWVDVECTDCGTTLPGDPTPAVLPTDPFDVDGNIVCP